MNANIKDKEINFIPLDCIICGDVIKTLREFPDNSIDLVVTSPPYNLRNSTSNSYKYKSSASKWKNSTILNKGYDNYDDNLPYDKYVNWQRDVLFECMRVLKTDGAIFYNHKWRVQNGLIQDRHEILQDFPVRQIIIWKRKGGINFNPGYFLPTYEVIYMIAKKDFKLLNNCIGYGDVWEIQQEKNNPHPAPFPVELATKIISSTNSNVILDPFMGSGTTALAAKMLNRHYVGIEISEKYCDMANSRIKNYKNIEDF